MLNELDLCAADAKCEPDEHLSHEFLREFAKEKPEVLQWAFRAHRRQSRFFPCIAEIHALVARRRYELWEEAESERRRIEKLELEKARALGQLVDFADLKAKLAAVVKKMP